MRERGATVQIVDLSGEGIQAVYDSNTKTLEISADRIAQALSDPAAMAKLRAVVAHELQHLWHAERYADGHSFLHPDASTAQFTPSSVEDYAAKREAYTDVSVERGLADEVLSHHQHLLKGANYAPNSLYGQLATVFGNTQYGRLSREQFLEARRLIADFGYRERIAEAAAQTFDDVHGRMLDSSSQPRASVDGESSAPQPASAGKTFTYGMRDNAGNTVSVALAFDALAFNDSTRTLEFERASGLDRYFFGMPDATGTVKQAILAQVVSVTEPGSTPEMPDFEYGVFFHDLHPLMGDSNGIGEGGYYARFSNEVELGGPLIDLVTSTGIDHVQAHAEILRLLPFDEMASRYAASAIRALFERARTGLNRRDPRDETHNFALNNLLNEAANTEDGPARDALVAQYSSDFIDLGASRFAPEAVYSDFLMTAALDQEVGFTRIIGDMLNEVDVPQSVLDRFLPSRAVMAKRMEELSAQLPFDTFIEAYQAHVWPRLPAELRAAIQDRSAQEQAGGVARDGRSQDIDTQGGSRQPRASVDGEGETSATNAGSGVSGSRTVPTLTDDSGRVWEISEEAFPSARVPVRRVFLSLGTAWLSVRGRGSFRE